MSKEKSIVVVDGDVIAYRACAALEERYVEVTHNDTREVQEFATGTLFKQWVGEDENKYTVVPKQRTGDISHTFHALDGSIKNIVERSGCDKFHIVISGENNFRLQLPLPTRYKAVRKDVMKPIHLAAAKAYLVKKYKAEVSDGVEADDVLVGYGVDGYRRGVKVVQATNDKDANHGPSWVFNFTNADDTPILIEGFGKLHETTSTTKTIKGQGRIFLYFQMLYGDPADGYRPAELAKRQCGEKGVYTLLKGCKTDKQALQAVADKYKEWYPSPVKYKDWNNVLQEKNWIEIWQMYADCAHMQRWPGDRFIVSDVLNKLGVN